MLARQKTSGGRHCTGDNRFHVHDAGDLPDSYVRADRATTLSFRFRGLPVEVSGCRLPWDATLLPVPDAKLPDRFLPGIITWLAQAGQPRPRLTRLQIFAFHSYPQVGHFHHTDLLLEGENCSGVSPMFFSWFHCLAISKSATEPECFRMVFVRAVARLAFAHSGHPVLRCVRWRMLVFHLYPHTEHFQFTVLELPGTTLKRSIFLFSSASHSLASSGKRVGRSLYPTRTLLFVPKGHCLPCHL